MCNTCYTSPNLYRISYTVSAPASLDIILTLDIQIAMTKYDYTGLFQASGGNGDTLPATETRSLHEALGYLSAINNGVLRAPALVEGPNGGLITVMAVVKYDAINGKSDERIYELLDKSVDEQIQAASPDAFNAWNVDLGKVFPRQ